MPIMARKPKSDFTPAPPGPAQAVCVDVVDLGMVEKTYKDNTKKVPMVRFTWELSKKMPEGRPYIAGARFTNSMHEKASLRKFLESWRGKPFTKEQIDGFDLEKLLGANALLNIVHKEVGENTYANIASISPLLDGMTKLQPTGNFKRAKDRDDYVAPNYDEQPVEREPGLDDDLPPVESYENEPPLDDAPPF